MAFAALSLSPDYLTGGAYAVASNASRIVGFVATDTAEAHRAACYWDTPASDPVLIGADFSEAYGVSGDGSVIIGDTETYPFIWTASAGYVTFGGIYDAVWGISADGTRLVGATSSDGSHWQACYWDRSFTRTDLGWLSGHDDSTALAVSADGSCIVGYSRIEASDSTTRRPFRWTSSGGMVNLGLVGTATCGSAMGVSSDGGVVAVSLDPAPDPTNSAAKWTLAGGMVLLPILTGAVANSFAVCTSGDGATIVGVSDTVVAGVGQNREALAWWTSAGITVPPPPAFTSDLDAKGVNHDASLIVGTSHGTGGFLPWFYGPVAASVLALDNLLVTTPATVSTTGALVFLDWSDDRGHRYGNPVGQVLGPAGDYEQSVQWRRLGYARDRVFRVSWSMPVETALQGAWVDIESGDT